MTQSRFVLQTKIIIIFALAVVSVVGVSTSIAMVLTRQLVEEEIYSKACTQARSTAHQLANEDALQDTTKLQRVLKQILHDMPGVRQADVFLHGSPHQLEATTAPQAEHLELDNIPGIQHYDEFERPDDESLTIETDHGRYWIIGVTIRSQGQPVGCLNLKVSKSQTSVVTRHLVVRNLLLMLASLVVVILAVHVFFLRAVRTPVKDMIRVMEGAEKGQLYVRASLRSTDEIGMLAAHLNRMLRRIENFNTELERKVQESTAGLAEANEELRRINEELFETQKNLAPRNDWPLPASLPPVWPTKSGRRSTPFPDTCSCWLAAKMPTNPPGAGCRLSRGRLIISCAPSINCFRGAASLN